MRIFEHLDTGISYADEKRKIEISGQEIVCQGYWLYAKYEDITDGVFSSIEEYKKWFGLATINRDYQEGIKRNHDPVLVLFAAIIIAEGLEG